jgi:hypothetical protein
MGLNKNRPQATQGSQNHLREQMDQALKQRGLDKGWAAQYAHRVFDPSAHADGSDFIAQIAAWDRGKRHPL